jgi:hypothetical protein
VERERSVVPYPQCDPCPGGWSAPSPDSSQEKFCIQRVDLVRFFQKFDVDLVGDIVDLSQETVVVCGKYLSFKTECRSLFVLWHAKEYWSPVLV